MTLFVHGLGAIPGEARVPASGVRGTRVVATLPGHGEAPDAPPGYWDYGRVAEDVLAVADEVGATRAVGVSLGSGALTRIAYEHPARFERLALLLPASVGRPRGAASRSVFERLAGGVDAAATDGGARLREIIAEGVPAGAEVGDYVSQRSTALLRLGEALRVLPGRTAVPDVDALGAVESEVLVIGATDDPMHPAEVAEEAAAAFPRARLELMASPAPMLTHRRELRAMLTDFLR